MNYNISRFALFLITIFLLSSCWTSKNITTEPTPVSPAVYFLDSVKSNYLDFNTLSIKYNSKFESEKKNLSFSGQIRIKHDSIIWISVSPAMGIEAMRLVFTPDSVMLLNRIDNSYLTDSYDIVTKYTQTEINFKFLQSLFLNELIPYKYNADVKVLDNYIVNSDSSHIILTNNNSNINDSLNKTIVHIISILKDIKKVDNISTYDNASNRNIKINYSEFENEEGKQFPTNINLVLKNKADFINLSIKYSKITNDKNLNFPFNIPRKFERINY